MHIGIGIQRGWTTDRTLHVDTRILILLLKIYVFWYSRWTDRDINLLVWASLTTFLQVNLITNSEQLGVFYLMVRAAGRGLVGAGDVLGLCPRSLCYALAARALPSRFALHAHDSGFALTTIK